MSSTRSRGICWPSYTSRLWSKTRSARADMPATRRFNNRTWRCILGRKSLAHVHPVFSSFQMTRLKGSTRSTGCARLLRLAPQPCLFWTFHSEHSHSSHFPNNSAVVLCIIGKLQLTGCSVAKSIKLIVVCLLSELCEIEGTTCLSLATGLECSACLLYATYTPGLQEILCPDQGEVNDRSGHNHGPCY